MFVILLVCVVLGLDSDIFAGVTSYGFFATPCTSVHAGGLVWSGLVSSMVQALKRSGVVRMTLDCEDRSVVVNRNATTTIISEPSKKHVIRKAACNQAKAQ